MINPTASDIRSVVEESNRTLAEVGMLGFAKFGVTADMEAALHFDPAKVRYPTVQEFAESWSIRTGRKLFILEQPGLYESEQQPEREPVKLTVHRQPSPYSDDGKTGTVPYHHNH